MRRKRTSTPLQVYIMSVEKETSTPLLVYIIIKLKLASGNFTKERKIRKV